MKRRLHLLALLLLALPAGPAAVDRPSASAVAFGTANEAWARGEYIPALTGYIRLVNGPDAPEYFDAIALQTGELYQSVELTTDGRNPRFSPDGRFIAYETGLEVSRRTRIVRNDASRTPVADLPGISAAFSSSTVAYLKIADTPALRSAAQALDATSLTARNRSAVVQALAWQILRNVSIALVDLDSRQERDLASPGLLKAALTFSADGRTLYFLGRPEAREDGNDIYAVSIADSGAQPKVVGDAARLKGVPVVEPTGRVLLYVVPTQDPLRRPPSDVPTGAVPAEPAPPPRAFGVIDLASGRTTLLEGVSPALSADGSALAYVAPAGAESHLMVGSPLGAKTAVKKTAGRFDAPALSADGGRIAWQAMTRDDWDIFVADRDGGRETRVTRDVQHDLLPQFIGNDRLLEVIGEPRHRRSFIDDLTSGARTRLFHNNTLRTIAPEYQWVLSPDRTKLLIGAERDGNTVSPERGVYLIHLGQKISKAALVQRLETNLAAERALRAAQTAAFAPIAKEVRDILDLVSVDRIFSYERSLFDFDSKHISRPGNQRASEYLFNTYRSFGYEPEYQWFEPRMALGGRTANVVATLRGTVNPELVYVVSSHYDSVIAGPGADDDSSGTAALLEAARVMAGHPQPATIMFASFTGEEAGLLGSREFVRRAVAGKLQIAGALNNDMIGWSNDARLDNTIRYSNAGIRDIQHGAAMLFTRLITYDARYFKGTDAMSYYDAYGDIVGGIGSYPVLSNPHYHQSHDLLEFENHDLIAETSKTTVATLVRLASSPSRITNVRVDAYDGGRASVSWTPSPEKGVSSYVVSIAPPAAGGGQQPRVPPRTVRVTSSRATLTGVTPGAVISVKAVNARGLESWDAAHVAVGEVRP